MNKLRNIIDRILWLNVAIVLFITTAWGAVLGVAMSQARYAGYGFIAGIAVVIGFVLVEFIRDGK